MLHLLACWFVVVAVQREIIVTVDWRRIVTIVAVAAAVHWNHVVVVVVVIVVDWLIGVIHRCIVNVVHGDVAAIVVVVVGDGVFRSLHVVVVAV